VDAASQGSKCIKVISDDTDVFVMLVHYYQKCSLTCTPLMKSNSKAKTLTDIVATVKQHTDIACQLLAAHAFTGCDTVASMFGIGKKQRQ